MGAHQGGREAAVPVMPAQSYHRGGGTVPRQLNGGWQLVSVLLGTMGQRACIQ